MVPTYSIDRNKLYRAFSWVNVPSEMPNRRFDVINQIGLIRSGLIGSGLIGSGLRGSGLIGSDLIGSGLIGSGLIGSGLIGSGLIGSGLIGSGLIGSGLRGSGLIGSGLIGLQETDPMHVLEIYLHNCASCLVFSVSIVCFFYPEYVVNSI